MERVVASPSPQTKAGARAIPIGSPIGHLKADAEDDELGVNLITPRLDLDEKEYDALRPSDPIAGMLFTAPSPLPTSKEPVDTKSPSARKRLSNLSLDSPKLQKIPKPVK